MDNSGRIQQFPTMEVAKRAGFRHGLTEEQAAKLQTMPKRERVRYARERAWISPEEQAARQRNLAEARAKEKRKRKATLRMKKRARALSRA